MLKYYFKFAIRNFKSNKVIFGGSLLTLSLGALCISLLFSYSYNEVTTDEFHENKEDIYAIVYKRTQNSQLAVFEPSTFFGFNYGDHPELKSLTSISRLPDDYMKFTYGDLTFSANGLAVDSTFLDIFDFNLKIGNKNTVLKEPNTVLLTEEFAHKIFGNINPVGEKLKISWYQEKDFIVSGILKNLPANSSINFDFIVPENRGEFGRMGGDFILVNENFNRADFEEKIKSIGNSRDDFKGSEFSLMPIKDIYFDKGSFKDVNIFSRYGDKKNLNTLFIIMLVVLVISALNFSNLQIINSNKRVKNSAVKRINGAKSSHISKQKIAEIVVLILLSAAIITVAYFFVLPKFNSLTQVYIDPPIWSIILLNIAVLLLITLAGMIYPLFVADKISLIKSLRNQSIIGSHMKGRRAIIVVQYTLTFMLIISSAVVVKQLDHMLSKELGFDTDNIVTVQLLGQGNLNDRNKTKEKYEYLKNSLNANPNIKYFSQGSTPLEVFAMDWKREDGDHKYTTQNLLAVNLEYDKVHGLEIVEGRFFEKGKDSSRGQQIVINEAAKKYWNITNINESSFLNKSWSEGPYGGGAYNIVGVVKDFNYEHLSSKPEPLFMVYFENFDDKFIIKFEKDSEQSGLAFVEELFKEQNPNEAFNYAYLEDKVAALYQKEKQLSINYILFTLIALIISAIGLFTIALYDTQRRVKEIAVRKVNGARVKEILVMLNKSIVKWIGLAFIIASPIAYILMHKWLENFAYKASMSWWIFASAGAFTLIIALLTVSWRSYKAAAANPVESLRSE